MDPDINHYNLSTGWIELYDEKYEIDDVLDFYPMYSVKNIEIIKDYIEFLSEVRRFSLEVVLIQDVDSIGNIQFYCEEMESDEWICIGNIIDELIFISTIDGRVAWLQGLPEEEKTIKELGDFNHFMNNYVFGKKYLEIYDGQELKWYKKLQEAKLIM